MQRNLERGKDPFETVAARKRAAVFAQRKTNKPAKNRNETGKRRTIVNYVTSIQARFTVAAVLKFSVRFDVGGVEQTRVRLENCEFPYPLVSHLLFSPCFCLSSLSLSLFLSFFF